MKKFIVYKQTNQMDCGPTCLRMIAKHYKKNYSAETLRAYSGFARDGVSLLGISDAAEKIGLRSRGVKIDFQQLTQDVKLPCILHWQQKHFVVLPPQRFKKSGIIVADPAGGAVEISIAEFKKSWCYSSSADQTGVALLLEPTAQFYDNTGEISQSVGWNYLGRYLKGYRKLFFQLILGMTAAALLQLIIPFLTQGLIDHGVRMKDIQFVHIILAAQLMLFFSRITVDLIRNRILLYISTHINVAILSDFWIKLMRLPIHFFDTKKTGDTLQRISDHKRIEQFLTGGLLSSVSSVLNLIVFSLILLTYNAQIFFIFGVGSLLYFSWIKLFMRFRRKLDYERFSRAAKENSCTLQLIQGMQEIKLNNAERVRRWEWESLQASLFKLSYRSLNLSQTQQLGAFFINEGKNILITFFAAKAVMEGQITLGTMLAIQYMIGQLNGPVEQLIGFFQQSQDARISLERLSEIHSIADEEPAQMQLTSKLPESKGISIQGLSFTYPGAGNEPVLNNIDLEIPENKVTAIVGMSGSGKTTLLKILLRFYDSYRGSIRIGGKELRYISPSFWRKQCGSVMQDGFIFSDTIAKNIAVAEEAPDYVRLAECAKAANILSFIESLPAGFDTLIGAEGNGISQGQRQRILIARALYRSPTYVFFDEATNALDANNERDIMEHLEEFFKGRTVIVVAHRLSTVKNADHIIVLDQGRIAEAGTHEALTAVKGHYFRLVRNQLELGNS